MPNRAMSKRGPPTAIISKAQQAKPNCAGHSELFRDQLTSCSTLVSRKPLGSCSSRPITCLRPCSRQSVPVQTAPAPDVHVRERDGGDEQHDLHNTEDA